MFYFLHFLICAKIKAQKIEDCEINTLALGLVMLTSLRMQGEPGKSMRSDSRGGRYHLVEGEN